MLPKRTLWLPTLLAVLLLLLSVNSGVAEEEEQFVGMGVAVDADQDGILVKRVLPGGPAEKAGIKDGDRILEIDGRSTTGMSIEQFVKQARGRAGTPVQVVLLRGNGSREEITVVRAAFQLPTIAHRMLDDRIGVITIERLPKGVEREVAFTIGILIGKGAKGLILDLRGPANGNPDTIQEVADAFIPPGHPLWAIELNGVVRDPRLTTQDALWTGPIVAIIGKNSGPACELLATALHRASLLYKERKPEEAPPIPALLIGSATQGTARLRELVVAVDGSKKLIDRGHFYTPDKKPILGVGIRPDKVLNEREDALTVAASELKSMLSASR